MARLMCWTTINGAPTAILTCLGGQVVMTELGQFSAHELRFAASDARTIQAMKEWTLLEIVQEGVGTIGWGYVVNPQQAITDRDEHVITVRLEQLTHELTWRRTRRGWQAKNLLSTVQRRLVSLAPNWTGWLWEQDTLDPSGKPYDIIVQVKLNNPTLLGGYLQVAQQFAQYVRLGANADGTVSDANGNPIRRLEMGQFGAAPRIWLTSANRGDADAMGNNPLIRLPGTIAWEPNNVEDFCNVTVPFGGGQDGDSLVTLERLWRIINDPTYPGYARYGTDAQSIARTGLPSLFPEYDPAYPISDPEHPPTGAWQWAFVDSAGNPVAGSYIVGFGAKQPDGSVAVYVFDAGTNLYRTDVFAQMLQGPYGTRGVTLDGHFDYLVFDAASYATYGHKETRDYVDSSLTYTSNSPADQELTERALYQSVVGFFKRYAHPHHTFQCVTNDAHGVPTRAGDLVATDVQRVSVSDAGAVVELDVTENLRVLNVTRSFNGDDPAVDTWTLSNLGRFDQTDATGAADTSRAIVALQRNQGTGLGTFYLPWMENIDAANPIIIPFFIAKEHFRYHQVRVQCDFYPFRGTATTATNIAGTPVVSADVELLITTPNDLGINKSFDSTLVNLRHSHVINVSAPASTPSQNSTLHYVHQGGRTSFLEVGWPIAPSTQGTGGELYTNDWVLGTSADNPDPNHGHATQITHTIAAANSTIGHIAAGQRLANLPAHTHDVEKRIPTGTPSPVNIRFAVNGVYLSSGARVTGPRQADGAFTSSFVIDDIGPTLDLYPAGAVVPLRFDAGTSGGNPFGVGYLRIVVSGVEELGGLSSTVSAS